jgi:serine protein kinase
MSQAVETDIFSVYKQGFEVTTQVEMSLAQYLEGCRDNPLMYATAQERLLAAIGEPEMVDTSQTQQQLPQN